jgi:hypothetical protein
MGMTLARTKFGMKVAAVALNLVGNCSAEMVINCAQYPAKIPIKIQVV